MLLFGGHRTGIATEHVTFGASLSTTVMVWMQLAWPPQASVAVHVIVVTPFGYGSLNVAGGSLRTPTTVAGPQLALAVAVAVAGLTCAVHRPGSVLAVMSPGQVTHGGGSGGLKKLPTGPGTANLTSIA